MIFRLPPIGRLAAKMRADAARLPIRAATTRTRTTTAVLPRRLAPDPDPVMGTTPLPRSSHGLSALGCGDRLVLYGGESVPRTPIADESQSLWLAERRTAAGSRGSAPSADDDDGDRRWGWISLGTPEDGVAPPPRLGHSQASVGDAVYVFGGRTGVDVSEAPLNDLWRLEVVAVDVDDDDGGGGRRARWTRIAAPEKEEGGGGGVGVAVPEARSFHRMIAVNSSLYMFGGCGSSGRLNDMWKFDTLSKRWTNLGMSHLLRGRGGPNVLSLSPRTRGDEDDVRIAIVAGFAGEETNDGHVYSSSSGSWEHAGMDGVSGAMRKRSVCCFGSFPKLDRCLIFGGEVDPSAMEHEGAGTFESDFVVLDGASGRVIDVIAGPAANEPPRGGSVGSWPEARGWSDAAVGAGGDTLYIFGGLAGDDVTPRRLDDLWECKVVVVDD